MEGSPSAPRESLLVSAIAEAVKEEGVALGKGSDSSSAPVADASVLGGVVVSSSLGGESFLLWGADEPSTLEFRFDCSGLMDACVSSGIGLPTAGDSVGTVGESQFFESS